MKSALRSWRANNVELPQVGAAVRRFHNGRVAPTANDDNDDHHLTNSTLEAAETQGARAPLEPGMSSTTSDSIISATVGVDDVESRCAFNEDELLPSVRQLRIVTANERVWTYTCFSLTH